MDEENQMEDERQAKKQRSVSIDNGYENESNNGSSNNNNYRTYDAARANNNDTMNMDNKLAETLRLLLPAITNSNHAREQLQVDTNQNYLSSSNIGGLQHARIDNATRLLTEVRTPIVNNITPHPSLNSQGPAQLRNNSAMLADPAAVRNQEPGQLQNHLAEGVKNQEPGYLHSSRDANEQQPEFLHNPALFLHGIRAGNCGVGGQWHLTEGNGGNTDTKTNTQGKEALVNSPSLLDHELSGNTAFFGQGHFDLPNPSLFSGTSDGDKTKCWKEMPKVRNIMVGLQKSGNMTDLLSVAVSRNRVGTPILNLAFRDNPLCTVRCSNFVKRNAEAAAHGMRFIARREDTDPQGPQFIPIKNMHHALLNGVSDMRETDSVRFTIIFDDADSPAVMLDEMQVHVEENYILQQKRWVTAITRSNVINANLLERRSNGDPFVGRFPPANVRANNRGNRFCLTDITGMSEMLRMQCQNAEGGACNGDQNAFLSNVEFIDLLNVNRKCSAAAVDMHFTALQLSTPNSVCALPVDLHREMRRIWQNPPGQRDYSGMETMVRVPLPVDSGEVERQVTSYDLILIPALSHAHFNGAAIVGAKVSLDKRPFILIFDSWRIGPAEDHARCQELADVVNAWHSSCLRIDSELRWARVQAPAQSGVTCAYHVCHWGHCMAKTLQEEGRLEATAAQPPHPLFDYAGTHDEVVMETQKLMVAMAMRLAEHQQH